MFPANLVLLDLITTAPRCEQCKSRNTALRNFDQSPVVSSLRRTITAQRQRGNAV
jgi:hypothetical protein